MSFPKKEHWSLREDPFSISKPEGNLPSPKQEQSSAISLIDLEDKPKGQEHDKQYPPLTLVDPQIGKRNDLSSTSGYPQLPPYPVSMPGVGNGPLHPYNPPQFYSQPLGHVSNGYPILYFRDEQRQPAAVHSSGREFYSSDEEAPTSSSPSKMKPAKPSIPRPSSTHTPSIINSMDQLTSLGKWEILGQDDDMYKIIKTYVNNSSRVKASNGNVKVHQVHRLVKGLLHLPKFKNFQMMLWWKTSPEGVRRLEHKQDGCIAFYDRIARAFSKSPEEMDSSFRQIILLCTVELGDKTDSTSGYRHWHSRELPQGYNSIKGVGRLKPDWGGNEEKRSGIFNQSKIIIPCGKTTVNKGKKQFELEYNEYMVFQADRVKVEYAVDVEFMPKKHS